MTDSWEKTIPSAVVGELIRGDVYYWGELMAGALLGSVPIALVYVIFLDYSVSGLTADATKVTCLALLECSSDRDRAKKLPVLDSSFAAIQVMRYNGPQSKSSSSGKQGGVSWRMRGDHLKRSS